MSRQQLSVKILQGRDLKLSDNPNEIVSCFATFKIGDLTYNTKAIPRTNNPSWSESFRGLIDPETTLEISVFDKGLLKSGFIGYVVIPVYDRCFYHPGGEWLDLCCKPGKREKIYGKIQVELQWLDGYQIPYY
eukprot:TRINITY_DN7333_c0_g1_i1.p1 TRINITY_DN7333_c0_g1~~TRINITY_DN7333_c0_g1_i1.p1  ORF type:complete len:145 (-),score=36.99 TRINITY_DN7333_c0_g1_i1:67-465(-)